MGMLSALQLALMLPHRLSAHQPLVLLMSAVMQHLFVQQMRAMPLLRQHSRHSKCVRLPVAPLQSVVIPLALARLVPLVSALQLALMLPHRLSAHQPLVLLMSAVMQHLFVQQVCATPSCTTAECCYTPGTCTTGSAGVCTAARLDASSPPICASTTCTIDECCDAAPVCAASVCDSQLHHCRVLLYPRHLHDWFRWCLHCSSP